ncbi:MAG: tetratricopeptide repeat protein [Candidatus Competibacteraceae bacterium]|nr:tetratricopeptide repeat protein [Candidatus Competibacteraceae bacterium]
MQSAIENCRAVVLMWSAAAAETRWVASELLSAIHLARRVIPYCMDDTPLPHCLGKLAYITASTDVSVAVSRLLTAIQATDIGTPLVPLMRAAAPELREALEQVTRGQQLELELLQKRKLAESKAVHEKVATVVCKAEEVWPHDPEIIKRAAYHRKNEYMLEHWNALQAGQAPQNDPLLRAAETGFFKVLFIDPMDCDGLDGLASVLMLEQDIEAAIFFDSQTVLRAALQGIDYSAAKQNLQTLWRYRSPQGELEVIIRQSLYSRRAESDQHAETADRKLHEGDPQAALKSYEHALILDPGHVHAHVYRGAALQQLGKIEEGFAAIQKALELDPNSPEALSALGAFLVGRGDYEKGLLVLDMALKLRPNYPEALYNKACAYSQMIEGEQALGYLRQAIEQEPAYRQIAAGDPHFESLRSDARFATSFEGLLKT